MAGWWQACQAVAWRGCHGPALSMGERRCAGELCHQPDKQRILPPRCHNQLNCTGHASPRGHAWHQLFFDAGERSTRCGGLRGRHVRRQRLHSAAGPVERSVERPHAIAFWQHEWFLQQQERFDDSLGHLGDSPYDPSEHGGDDGFQRCRANCRTNAQHLSACRIGLAHRRSSGRDQLYVASQLFSWFTMTHPFLCPRCSEPCRQYGGRGACTAALVLLSAIGAPATLEAQTTSKLTTGAPLPVETTASVVVGAVFQLDPIQPQLGESGPPIDRCSPLTCFRGSLLVRSNAAWQLQVRIDPAFGISSPVSWLPLDASEVSLGGAWATVRSGSTATPGTALALRFGVGGANSQRPTASTLTNALQYRIIALP